MPEDVVLLHAAPGRLHASQALLVAIERRGAPKAQLVGVAQQIAGLHTELTEIGRGGECAKTVVEHAVVDDPRRNRKLLRAAAKQAGCEKDLLLQAIGGG